MNRERLKILLKVAFWGGVLLTIAYTDITTELYVSRSSIEKAAATMEEQP
jgi:hypothetical protein